MTITEVSKRYGLSPDTLRYYERIGLIPAVHRTSGGVRDYTPSDCEWVEFIKCMRSAGVQVDALAEYVALFQQGDATASARKQILVEQRDRLLKHMTEMQTTLARLDQKIQNYEAALLPAENHLLKAQAVEI